MYKFIFLFIYKNKTLFMNKFIHLFFSYLIISLDDISKGDFNDICICIITLIRILSLTKN